MPHTIKERLNRRKILGAVGGGAVASSILTGGSTGTKSDKIEELELDKVNNIKYINMGLEYNIDAEGIKYGFRDGWKKFGIETNRLYLKNLLPLEDRNKITSSEVVIDDIFDTLHTGFTSEIKGRAIDALPIKLGPTLRIARAAPLLEDIATPDINIDLTNGGMANLQISSSTDEANLVVKENSSSSVTLDEQVVTIELDSGTEDNRPVVPEIQVVNYGDMEVYQPPSNITDPVKASESPFRVKGNPNEIIQVN